MVLLIGVLSFFENAFPPIPSDVAVALGGFITHRSPVTPGAVFLAGWLGNFAGTVVVFLLARRYGRQFFATRLGRKLLTPESIMTMEREYLRFGVAGIFISRLLPGFRTFVGPFVGLVNLPPATALLPILAASGIWYAFLTWAGVRLGAEWEAINRFVGQLNSTLAVVAGAVTLLLLVAWFRRPKPARPRHERILRAIHHALGNDIGELPAHPGLDPAMAGAAALLDELARADQRITPEERDLITGFLREQWGLGAEGRPSASHSAAELKDTREVTAVVTEQYRHEQRLALVEQLWRIAWSDGLLDRHEDRLMQRAADLLGLTPADLAETRRRLIASPGTSRPPPGPSARPDHTP